MSPTYRLTLRLCSDLGNQLFAKNLVVLAVVSTMGLQRVSLSHMRGHGGRVVTLSPPTSEAGVRSLHRLKWESW